MGDFKYDVVIIGAGISGIGTAYWLQKKCPKKKICILEGRKILGGTWSLFKYPGLRSDSDMFTFGYRFRPWTDPQSLSSGADILQYLKDTVKEFDLEKYIKFQHKVVNANWSDKSKTWILQTETPNGIQNIETTFLSVCSGYYDYKQAHRPTFKGESNYKGKIIIPQFWNPETEVKDKKIVVVGSGATAVTLVPSLTARDAEKVTMLQRSPTYIMNLPNRNQLFVNLKKIFPMKIAYKVARWQNIFLQMVSFRLSKMAPKFMKKTIMKDIVKQLPKGYPVDKHFNPKYNPWEQRLCVVPDGDLFTAIREGKADIATDTIDTFVEDGLILSSGEKIEADYVVLATGLKLQLFGGANLCVNGKVVDVNSKLMYKGMLMSDVPNMIYAFGYTNAPWTLKVDLTANYLCKILNYMDSKNYKVVLPVKDKNASEEDFLNMSSGYIQRAKSILPKQGEKRPWRVYQSYFVDMLATRFRGVKDKFLKYH